MVLCLLCPENFRSKDISEIMSLKCGHTFCLTCLNDYLKKNMNCKIRCPESICNEFISDKIIRKILSPEDISKYEICCLVISQQIRKCLLPQCTGVFPVTDHDVQYKCGVCSLYNCTSCNAAHAYRHCNLYKALPDNEKLEICKKELDEASKKFRTHKGLQLRSILWKEDVMDVLLNESVFICKLCLCNKAKKEGRKIRFCQHSFCDDCLRGHIESCDNTPVKCPHENCDNTLGDREIRGILSRESLIIYLSKCYHQLKNKLPNYVYCKYPDCGSLYTCSVRPAYFTCINCENINCVSCNAIHPPENCNNFNNSNMSTNETEEFIESEIKKKKFMKCLDCNKLLEKTKGCNWIQCPGCRTELCWITQNYRWGKNGPGDISGGCRCDVNGKRCCPECTSSCIPHRNHPSHAKYRESVNTNTSNTQDNSWCVIS